MMIGFEKMAIGAFIFIPATLFRTYEISLLDIFDWWWNSLTTNSNKSKYYDLRT